MELLFIDESGDNGFAMGSTEIFSLAGISLESTDWKTYFWKIKQVKQAIAQKYGLTFNELKGSEIFSHRGPLFDSLVTTSGDIAWIYEQFIELICDPMTNLFVISLSKSQFKQNQYEMEPKNIMKVFNKRIWVEYLSLYETHLLRKAERRGMPETGMIYSDVNSSQEKYIREVVRDFTIREPHSALVGTGIVEDPVFRDSKRSPFIQLADILAFTVNRLFTGKRASDVIGISPQIRAKLRDKIQKPLCSL